MLRVVPGGGGGVAGSHSPTYCSVVAAHTHSGGTNWQDRDHSHYTSTGGHSNDHNHSYLSSNDQNAGVRTDLVQNLINDGLGWTNTNGVSADHSHSGQSGGESQGHTHGFSTDNGSSQTNWTPRYNNCIICQKN